MWAQVLHILKGSHRIGPSLALCCPRHKDTLIDVSIPDHFIQFAPEGGCSLKCSSRLLCGHSCPNMCHSASLHQAVRCLERCPRTKPGCKHECPRACGDQCDAECQVTLFDISSPRGHNARKLRCHEAQNPDKVRCRALVDQIIEHCDHEIQVRCHETPLNVDFSCPAICKAPLPYGHDCKHPCKDCNISIDGSVVKKSYRTCMTKCGADYTTCSHSCKVRCHEGTPWPSLQRALRSQLQSLEV
jgi:hypothetical protein